MLDPGRCTASCCKQLCSAASGKRYLTGSDHLLEALRQLAQGPSFPCQVSVVGGAVFGQPAHPIVSVGEILLKHMGGKGERAPDAQDASTVHRQTIACACIRARPLDHALIRQYHCPAPSRTPLIFLMPVADNAQQPVQKGAPPWRGGPTGRSNVPLASMRVLAPRPVPLAPAHVSRTPKQTNQAPNCTW